MNLGETTLYLAVTRANAVWKLPLMHDGSVSKVGTYVPLSGVTGPDGLALDAQGRLAIAHTGLGCVWIVDAAGEPVYRIASCEGRHTTNVAYGRPDRKTLHITESGSGTVLTAQLDVPGKRMYSGLENMSSAGAAAAAAATTGNAADCRSCLFRRRPAS